MALDSAVINLQLNLLETTTALGESAVIGLQAEITETTTALGESAVIFLLSESTLGSGLIRNDQITVRNVASDRLLRYPVEILATRTGMDLTQTMNYEVYIVPTGNTLIPVGIIFEANAASGVTVAPIVGLGIDTGADEIFSTEGLVDFNVIGEVWSNWILAASQAVPSASSINLSITGGTASTLTASFYLVGFLV